MSNFWPSDLNLKDTSSPSEIITEASKEWHTRSQGQLVLQAEPYETDEGDEALTVFVQHIPTSRAISLFTVNYRANHPYPARFFPKGDELPNYLKKSYKSRSLLSTVSLDNLSTGQQIQNEWVCDTPTEFRENLKKIINLGSIRSRIVSLLSSPNQSDGESLSSSTELNQETS